VYTNFSKKYLLLSELGVLESEFEALALGLGSSLDHLLRGPVLHDLVVATRQDIMRIQGQ